MNIDEIIKNTFDNVKSFSKEECMLSRPFLSSDGSTIYPVNKIAFGFVAGGGEYSTSNSDKSLYPETKATGAGVTITPIGFLVCGKEKKFVSTEKADNKWIDIAKCLLNTIKDDE
ncbi:MAG: GerW family sporulation protein [Clostridia bacterium]|nr:GerW family sporulation protein [Clostridia bacterium]